MNKNTQEESARILQSAVEQTIPPKRSFYQKKRYWFLLILAILIGYTQIPGSCPISPQTHIITSPRTADGREIAYFRAFEESYISRLGQPEENGYRMVLAALGPRALEKDFLAKEYSWEDLPKSKAGKPWFEQTWKPICERFKLDPNRRPEFYDAWSLEDYIQVHGITGSEPILENKPLIRNQKVRFSVTNSEEQYSAYIQKLQSGQPWSASDNPQAAAWLEQNQPLLDLFVEASKKPIWSSYYLPPKKMNGMLSGGDSGSTCSTPPSLINLLLPDIQFYREIARDLSVRIGWNLNRAATDPNQAEQAIDQAIDDILAIYNVGRKAPDFILISRLVGFALETMAKDNVRNLIETKAATEPQLARLAAEIDALPPIGNMNKAGYLELLMADQSIRILCRSTNLSSILNAFYGEELADVELSNIPFLPYDERLARIQAKSFIDQYKRIFKDIPVSKRDALIKDFDKNLTQAWSEFESGNYWLPPILTIQSRSKMLGTMVIPLFFPSYETVFHAEYRTKTNASLVRTAIALERFKLKTGSYPQTLEQLVPEFLPSVPLDGFTDNSPIFYRLQDDGAYALYGVGVNRKDDGGQDNLNDGGQDNLNDGDQVFATQRK